MTGFKAWMNETKIILDEIKGIHKCNVDQLEYQIRRYIKHRYMLDRLPGAKDSIYSLAEESLAAMSKMDSADLHSMEDISGCTSAKSAMVKKVLLIMSFNNALEWGITEDECLEITTVEDIVKIGIAHIKA